MLSVKFVSYIFTELRQFTKKLTENGYNIKISALTSIFEK